MGEEDDPIQEEDNEKNIDSTVHKIKEEDKPKKDDEVTVDTVNNEEEGENEEQQSEEVVPLNPVLRPRAVQELESNLDGRH